LIGDEEVWMEDENMFAVYLFHKKKRHSIKKNKVRETQGANENMQVVEAELEMHIVLKERSKAVNRFKEKTNE